jgi:poly(3-hydroxybutyrate) depolymerase
MLTFAVLGAACSSGGSSSGSGGAQGTGGVASAGGTTGTGGSTPPGSGGQPGTGGRVDPGTGGTSTGGANTGGNGGSAGAASGGAAGTAPTGSGGTSAAGGAAGARGGAGGNSGSGGTAGAGHAGSGGNSASGGAAGQGSGGSTGAAGADGATPSAGCGKARALQNGTITLTSGGSSRTYILHAPSGYDSSHPYRLVFAYAWSGGSSTDVANSNYFRFSTMDSQGTIFVAPNASDGAGTWSSADVGFTDTILAQVEAALCIDETRVFATGFSFGGGMAIAIACTRADVFRAVAFFSGADLTNSCPTTLTKPIAYYASQASQDRGSLPLTSPIIGEVVQAKFAALNGCTAEPASTTYPASGQPHTCTHYQGCSAGHPTEYCVFNGPHGWEPVDPGQTTSWDPPEAWKFITQF